MEAGTDVKLVEGEMSMDLVKDLVMVMNLVLLESSSMLNVYGDLMVASSMYSDDSSLGYNVDTCNVVSRRSSRISSLSIF